MATKKDVELAAQVPELSKKIKEIRHQHLLMVKEEDERREKWAVKAHAVLAEIRTIEDKLMQAGEADGRIYREVPMEMRRDLMNAETALRAHGDAMARARLEMMSSQENYKRRIDASKRPGADALTKAQIEQFLDEIALKKAAFSEQEKAEKDLKARVAKFKTQVEAAVQALKKAAK